MPSYETNNRGTQPYKPLDSQDSCFPRRKGGRGDRSCVETETNAEVLYAVRIWRNPPCRGRFQTAPYCKPA